MSSACVWPLTHHVACAPSRRAHAVPVRVRHGTFKGAYGARCTPISKALWPTALSGHDSELVSGEGAFFRLLCACVGSIALSVAHALAQRACAVPLPVRHGTFKGTCGASSTASLKAVGPSARPWHDSEIESGGGARHR